MRAYDEIVQFERSLVMEGVIVVKFWLQVSQDEQLNPFLYHLLLRILQRHGASSKRVTLSCGRMLCAVNSGTRVRCSRGDGQRARRRPCPPLRDSRTPA